MACLIPKSQCHEFLYLLIISLTATFFSVFDFFFFFGVFSSQNLPQQKTLQSSNTSERSYL
ncbi:MAG: hypothetical protein AABZ60_21050, partial [Planctomycetota bacterium]